MTIAERKLLLRYRAVRGNAPSFGANFLRTTPYFLVLVAFVLATLFGDFSVEFTWFIVGAATGVFLRQVGYLLFVSRRSALLLEIVDWQRVDELLAEPIS